MMTYADYEILEGDSVEVMGRKIRARSMNHGAFLRWEGKRIYVDRLLGWSQEENEIPWQAEVEEETVRLYTGRKIVLFHLNKIEEIG